MEEIGAAKIQIREDIAKIISAVTASDIAKKVRAIEARVFGFAHFLEAKNVLLYVSGDNGVQTKNIIKRAHSYNKIVVLAGFTTSPMP